ncbi:MAG: hypothetical protein Q9159_003874 [Coniocarpon cinnabarinum]
MALPPSRTAGGVNALLIDFAESDLQQSIAKEQNELAHVLRVLFFWSVRIISLPPSQINQPEDFADEMIGVIQEHMQTNGHKPDLAFIHVVCHGVVEDGRLLLKATKLCAHTDFVIKHMDRPIDQSEDITILVEPPPGLLVLHAIPLREKGSSAKTPDTSKVL